MMESLLPTGRPSLNLVSLVKTRLLEKQSLHACKIVSICEPLDANFDALVKGMRKILPFMYREANEVVQTLCRYGLDFAKEVPLPPSPEFQFAHCGEFLSCAYFEECENLTVLTYKWRLSTTKNQHQFGMDLLAFDLTTSPPTIHAIPVKTTRQGGSETPSVIYKAISELKKYLESEQLDDDLEIIAANLQVAEAHQNLFLQWYDPYTQGIPASKPTIVATATIVIDEGQWNDDFAQPIINADFGVDAEGRIIAVPKLEELVTRAYQVEDL